MGTCTRTGTCAGVCSSAWKDRQLRGMADVGVGMDTVMVGHMITFEMADCPVICSNF